MQFKPTTDLVLYGARWNQFSTTNPALAMVWNQTTHQVLAIKPFHQPYDARPNSWLQCWFWPRVHIDTSSDLIVAVLANDGYSRIVNGLSSFVTRNNIEAHYSFTTTSIYPPSATVTINHNANTVDVLVLDH